MNVPETLSVVLAPAVPELPGKASDTEPDVPAAIDPTLTGSAVVVDVVLSVAAVTLALLAVIKPVLLSLTKAVMIPVPGSREIEVRLSVTAVTAMVNGFVFEAAPPTAVTPTRPLPGAAMSAAGTIARSSVVDT